MPTPWQGKRALITGASGGIGAAIARRLAREGIRVALTARRRPQLEALAADISAAGGEALVLPADLSLVNAREALAARLLARWDGLDLLINNAGFGIGRTFSLMTWSEIQSMLEVDVAAVIHLTRLFLPTMETQGYGWIVNIASIAGDIPGPPLSLYCAAKAMVQAFSEALYREERAAGIYVGVVNPGPVATAFWQTAAGWDEQRWRHFGVSAERVAEAVWWSLQYRRKRVYVPWAARFVHWINLLAGSIVDRAIPWFLHGPGRTMMHPATTEEDIPKE